MGKRIRATPKGCLGPERPSVPSVDELATRMSELLRLRDQVKKAEIWHLESKDAKTSAPRSRLK
jgi:hypothetical protein